LRGAGLAFVRDPVGSREIPNWNRVTAALPNFPRQLCEAVAADR